MEPKSKQFYIGSGGANDARRKGRSKLDDIPELDVKSTNHSVNFSIEGDDATQNRGGGKPFVSRTIDRPGKKRRARSLDGHPLMADTHSQSTNSLEVHFSHGDLTPKSNVGSGFSVIKGQRGRRRGTRSMVRFPFIAGVNDYMVGMKGVLAASTWKELERRY